MKFNKKRYASRTMFFAQVMVTLLALVCFGVLAASGKAFLGVVFLTLVSLCMRQPMAKLCAVTLSVPELLMDVLEAFKLETPELFGPNGFATEFKSNTAVLGDKVTAKISAVPTVGAYDANNGGFKAAAQDVTTLISDVPVTLDQFPVVIIKVGWLTQLASKIELYREAVRNYGFALGKNVVDACLAQVNPNNFSNQIEVALANVNLDTIDGQLRDQLNTQKTFGRGRFGIVGTPFASKFGSDDRVRSSLFYGALNGDQGYRIWNNIGGLGRLREYPDMFAGNKLVGFAGDRRAIAVATRRIDFSNAADAIGVPKVMEFYQVADDTSGVEMTGVAWQEAGTGDVYVGAGLLFGVGAGKQGGANGTITDNAGCRIVTP